MSTAAKNAWQQQETAVVKPALTPMRTLHKSNRCTCWGLTIGQLTAAQPRAGRSMLSPNEPVTQGFSAHSVSARLVSSQHALLRCTQLHSQFSGAVVLCVSKITFELLSWSHASVCLTQCQSVEVQSMFAHMTWASQMCIAGTAALAAMISKLLGRMGS